jgi:hypothetical protein
MLVPEPCAGVHVTHDPAQAPSLSQTILAFRVANGHLPAPTGTEPRLSDGERELERDAKRLGFDESVSFAWPEGERALMFEIDVPRNVARGLRISGPPALAWALFEPGTDGGWRPRSTASATGFAGGESQVKLAQGAWALVLFHDADSEAVPGAAVEIAFEDEDAKAVPSAFHADAHELRRFVLGTLVLAAALSRRRSGPYLPDHREHLDHVGTGSGRRGVPAVPRVVHGQHAVALLLQHADPARRGRRTGRLPSRTGRSRSRG